MKKLIITGAAVLTIGGSALALQPSHSTVATEKSPLIAQVENHEERIGDLETKTDATQTQVNQNTADIAEVQTQTNIKPAPQVQAVVTPVAQPAPSKQVETQPDLIDTTDGWTVTSIVEKQPANATYPDKIDLHCKFYFYNGQIGWGVTTTSNKYSHSPASCASNYSTNVGQVMTLTQRNNLRYDPAPF